MQKYDEWLNNTYKKFTSKTPKEKRVLQPLLFLPSRNCTYLIDIKGTHEDNLGFPGEYPFTRGIQPTMYRGKYWTMRQYAGFGNAKESNERYRYLLEQGQSGYLSHLIFQLRLDMTAMIQLLMVKLVGWSSN